MTRLRLTRSSDTDGESASAKLSRRDWLLVLVAPLVLIGVALNHQVVTATKNLTAWKGGGFGMFATVDQGGDRRVQVSATLRDGTTIPDLEQRGIVYFDDQSLQILRVIALPTTEKLRTLADQAITYYAVSADDPAVDTDDLVFVRVAVTAIDFDARTNRAETKVVASVEVPVS